ncbi:hypothetical protein CUMW_125880 [Citrus unshiu]|nr:hypothetical protein CUMW_125880 [Citrus unshiu]
MLRGWGKRALHCIKVRPTIGLGLLYQSLDYNSVLRYQPGSLPLVQSLESTFKELMMEKAKARLDQHSGDGWMKIEIGEYFDENGDDNILVSSLLNFDGSQHTSLASSYKWVYQLLCAFGCHRPSGWAVDSWACVGPLDHGRLGIHICVWKG